MRQISIDAGLGETYVRDMLQKGRVPTIDKFMRVLRVLDVTPDEILEVDQGSIDAVHDAMLTLTELHPYRDITLKMIADESGLRPAVIENHFDDLEDIVRRTILVLMEKYNHDLVGWMPPKGPVFQRLIALFRKFSSQVLLEHPAFIRVAYGLAWNWYDWEQEELKQTLFARREKIMQILEEAAANGEIRLNGYTSVLCDLLWCAHKDAIFSLGMDRTKPPNLDHYQDVLAGRFRVILLGLGDKSCAPENK